MKMIENFLFFEEDHLVTVFIILGWLLLIFFSLVADNFEIFHSSQVINNVEHKQEHKQKKQPTYIHIGLFHSARPIVGRTLIYNPHRINENNLFAIYPERKKLIIPNPSGIFPRQRGVNMFRNYLPFDRGGHGLIMYNVEEYNGRTGV
jgi:hypothetical protein